MGKSFCVGLKFLSLWCLLCLLLCFSSCENFFNGAQLRDEIEEAVYIANHESPVAKIEEPAFSDQGVAKNRAIVISFTQSMNPETLGEALSITSAQGDDLLPNFTTPIWSNDNKLVTIPANERNLINLQGKRAMDINVTLSKSCRTRDRIPIKDEVHHNYRISDSVDNTAPVLSLVRGELPPSYIGRNASSETILLSEKGFTAETEQEIIETNHIQSKANFYIEGNDRGGGDVYAHFKYSRVFDVSGTPVNESETDRREKLTFVNESGISYDTVCLDISEITAKDGIYKVRVTVSDASNLDSEDSKTYYLLRDTTLANSANSLFWFETPMFRNDLTPGFNAAYEKNRTDSGKWYDGPAPLELSAFDSQTPTIGRIEHFMYRIKFGILSDDVYYIPNYSSDSDLGKTKMEDFSYFISWGTDLTQLSAPVKIEGYDNEDNETEGNDLFGHRYYRLPDSYRAFQEANRNRDIYLQATVYDSVGNSNVINTLVPAQIEFYGYKVSDSSTPGKKKITLNYYDLSAMKKGLSNITNIPGKTNYALYRIYYGKIEEGTDVSEVALKRNTVTTYEHDYNSDLPDGKDFEVDAGSKYVFYIQPNYNMNSLTNEKWCGQTFGLPYRVIVDTNEAATSGSMTAPTFTCTKESAGLNTGLFNISITLTNPQAGVKYVPCYSTDGGNSWSYFESHVYSSGELQSNPAFTFQVKNPLKAPFDTLWNNDAKWKYYDGYNPYFKSVTECRAAYGYPGISAKVKVLAVSDGKSAESTATTITFTEYDDNIPPVQSPVLTNHDSWLDFDGHSFKFEGIVTEDEGHASTEASYYYMPYSSAWGDNLSVARAEQIASLPGGSATYTSSVWIDGGARYSLTLNIPLNGIPDGKYMFFAKVSDTYGNYSYITLGKADIGTFKNKLKVNWRMNQGKIQLVSTLPVETGEQNFDRNMINIQNFETSSGNWRDRYGRWNELQDCGTPILLDGKKVIRYETTTTPSNKIIKEVNQGNVLNCTEDELSLSSGWYRITMQSFNDNTMELDAYGNVIKDGVNKKHGRPYNENLYAEKSGYWDWEESKYDVFTDETVSNTAYIFVPSGDSYLDGIKSSFFPSTSTPRSNKCFIVNVISASRDLGTDPDEWERRGKLIKTHFYDPSDTIHYTQFNESVAADDMFNSSEKGLVYYVAVVHFADGSMAISKTYTMQGM